MAIIRQTRIYIRWKISIQACTQHHCSDYFRYYTSHSQHNSGFCPAKYIKNLVKELSHVIPILDRTYWCRLQGEYFSKKTDDQDAWQVRGWGRTGGRNILPALRTKKPANLTVGFVATSSPLWSLKSSLSDPNAQYFTHYLYKGCHHFHKATKDTDGNQTTTWNYWWDWQVLI